jgi:hypothetical protein
MNDTVEHIEAEEVADINGADILYKVLRKACGEFSVPAIGTALTAVLVDFAMHVNMDKQELMEIVSGTWDITLEETEVKH